MLKPWGYTVYDVDWATPVEVRPYLKAQELEYDRQDEIAWNHGYYNMLAHSVVLSHAFSDKKHPSKAEYPDKPCSKQDTSHEMTPEEYNSLPKKEQEKIAMNVIEGLFGGALSNFKDKLEGEKDG